MRARALPWALFVLALAAALAFAGLWQRAQAAEHRRDGVRTAASAFLRSLTNFSAATIDGDVRRIRGFAVGDFAGQVDRFFGPDVVAAIKRAGATSTGRIRAVFVESMRGGTAAVFGVVDESVTNRSSSPRNEVLRLDLGMIETTGGWKVDRVQILQSPGASPFAPG